MDERTPIFVLTGFLGSGKSTLLSACVREAEMDRTAVIVNEFGEVGLDHLLVTKGGEDTILLDSGCLCCLSNSQVQDTLLILHARRKRGEISFDRVVIETSGLAEPGPMLRPLMVDAFVQRNFRLAGVTATADAQLAVEQLARYEEARHQVACADRLVITKCDIAASEAIDQAKAAIRLLNPAADIALSPAERSAADILGFGDVSDDVNVVALDDEGAGTDHTYNRHVHNHSSGIDSFVLWFDSPVSWAGYAQWLEKVREIDGRQLLRTKGLLWFDDGELRLVQGVQHSFSSPKAFDGHAERSFLVMIVQDVERDVLQRIAENLIGTHSS